MSLTDIHPREIADVPEKQSPGMSAGSIVGTGVRACYAALAGLLLTCSLAVVIWAVTPSSGSGPVALLRAGVAAFSSANGMTVTIGRAALTMPPLMITVVAIALLATVNGRGRAVTTDRGQELASTGVAAAGYAAVVTACGVLLGPAGAVSAGQWWRPALLALAVVGCTTLVRGFGWRSYLHHRLPPWVPVSLRLGAVGTAALIGAGGVTVVIGLVRSWDDATTVASLAAPGAGGGFGMALLGIAYLPNAVIAGAGYAVGVGFTVGTGTFSPFGSSPTDLPAVPLLTAVPDSATYARSALLILVLPLLAGVFMGRGAIGRLEDRNDRMIAVAAAALFAGIASGLLATLASGGVAGGAWSSIGVPPFPFAVAVTVGLGVVGVGIAALGRVGAAATPTAGSDAGQLQQEQEMPPEVVQDGGNEPGEMTEPGEMSEPGEMTEPSEVTEPGEVTEAVQITEVSEPDERGDVGEADDVSDDVQVTEDVQVDETVQPDDSAAPVGEEPNPVVDHTAADVPDAQAHAEERPDEVAEDTGSDQAPVDGEEAPVAIAEDPDVRQGPASDAREGG